MGKPYLSPKGSRQKMARFTTCRSNEKIHNCLGNDERTMAEREAHERRYAFPNAAYRTSLTECACILSFFYGACTKLLFFQDSIPVLVFIPLNCSSSDAVRFSSPGPSVF